MIFEGINIEAIASCVPKNEIDNTEFGIELYGNDIKKIIKATGIEKRRVCRYSSSTSLDLCVKAAEEIFEKSGINKNDIGAIVFVTSSPEYVMPNNATLVQDILGLPTNIPAFDINLACSGYPYGLWNAALIANSTNKKVLLLDGDKQSHFTSKYDKATALLFSDAGSATIISKDNSDNKWNFSFETYGDRHEAIMIKDGGSKYWIQENSLEYYITEDGSKLRNCDLTMDGMGVFNFAVKDVPVSLKNLIEINMINIENIDILALHQANKFMIRQIAKNIGFPLEKTPIVVHKYGNSSSSTIPLVLTDTLETIIERKSILMSGFGAGLSIGTAYIEINNCQNFGVIESDL